MNPSDQVSTIPLCRKSSDNPPNLSWIHPIQLVRFRCAGVHLNLRRTCQQSDRYCFPRIWIFYILILMPLNLSRIDRTDGWIPVYYSFIGYVVFSVERGAEIHSQYVFLLLSPSLSPSLVPTATWSCHPRSHLGTLVPTATCSCHPPSHLLSSSLQPASFILALTDSYPPARPPSTRPTSRKHTGTFRSSLIFDIAYPHPSSPILLSSQMSCGIMYFLQWWHFCLRRL